ncbi:phosphotransferase family protein [Amycolatopsis sp. NPDC004378]
MTGSADLDLPALQRYFARLVPEAGELTATLIHGGRSNLTYRLTDGDRSWVLRRPPLGGLTPSAHDVAREYRVVAALSGTGVPVPAAVALEESTDVLGFPFSIVEFVPGPVIRSQDQLHELADADIRRCASGLIDVLGRLHAVDVDDVGLGQFGRPQGYLVRQLRRWRDQWQHVATRDLPDLATLHHRLEDRCPAESGASIVHGDYRIDNAILAEGNPGVVRALVDWEMATIGDPLADLGLHVAYSNPAFDPVLGGAAASTSPRLPDAVATVERYAKTTGRELPDMAFYLGLGYFKAAVIAEGIHARHRGGLTVGTGFDSVGDAVPRLLAAGIGALSDPAWS